MKNLQAHTQSYPHSHPHPDFSGAYDWVFSVLWIILAAGILFGLFKFIRQKKKKG